MNIYNISQNIKNNPDDWTAKQIEHIFMEYGWFIFDNMDIKDIEEYVRRKKLENLNKIK